MSLPIGFFSQKKYKNVALTTEGSSVFYFAGNVTLGAIGNIFKGYREVLASDPDATNKVVQVNDSFTVILDLGKVRDVREINFIGGTADGGDRVGSEVPNIEEWTAAGMPSPAGLDIQYSLDGVTFTPIPYTEFETKYLFNKNIITPITARYVSVYTPVNVALIFSGIEMWGYN